jgi:hypothetical protein
MTSAETTAGPIAATTHGRVRGSAAASHARFLGIPYAAAPVGELRWAAPQSPTGWNEVRDATSFGPAGMLALCDYVTPNESVTPKTFFAYWTNVYYVVFLLENERAVVAVACGKQTFFFNGSRRKIK